jgi:hypothetical protein
MKKNKNVVYFVLYIVILTELLIVITERDELEEVEHQIRDKMLTTLAKMYQQPVILDIPQRNSTYDLNSKNEMRIVLSPTGLVSDREKENYRVVVDLDENTKRRIGNWPKGGVSENSSNDKYRIVKENGNAIFIAKFDREGEFNFKAFCEVERELPDYLPEYLLDSLRAMVGELRLAKSSPENFSITAKKTDGVNKKEAEVSF